MPDSSAASPSPASAPGRLVVERVSGAGLAGWAYDPAAPGRERLWLEAPGRRVELPLQRRLRRADVGRALGLVGEPWLGFEADWPPQVLQALLPPGQAWRVRLEGSPVVADLPSGGPVALGYPQGGPKPPPPAHVEGWVGLCLSGWLADSPQARDVLRLRCGEQRHDVPLRRLSRADVAASLTLAEDEVGFEIEVPGSLWRTAAGHPALELQVEGRAGPLGEVFQLRRDELGARLEQALALDDPLQRAHQSLLALEHLAYAGAWDQVAPGARQMLQVLAESAGVGAWLNADAATLAGAERPALRRPFRMAARGRLGRWLQGPGRGQLALDWLASLRRWRALRPLADAWEVALTRACGLFDGACYASQAGLGAVSVAQAARHYVRHGDARSIVPMVLFDARHYTGQLPGRRHPGVNRLLHFALVGRQRGLSPCAWFDPAFYRVANPDVAGSAVDPLTHFVNWGHAERRRPAPRFEPTTGMRQGLLQRLGRGGAESAAVDPLQRYLMDGLPAEAQPADGGLPWAVATQLDGRDYLDLAAWPTLSRPAAAPQVAVLVPVYAGAQETLRCLWSVLQAPVCTPFSLWVVDDCSPEPALSQALRGLAEMGLLRLLVNERNLGFVGSVNRGLSATGDLDVVILNADTQVYAGWLDRLLAHAMAEPQAASITPLSNNATICSYPRPQHSNWERLELGPGELDALTAEVNRGHHVQAPTGVGFCMWLRRTALQAVGMLDEEHFGRGYGEENDWCMRAAAAGWVHVLAADVLVYHQGSVSFAAEAGERTRAGLQVLRQRHPDYLPQVQAWIAADPLAGARARLDAARLRRAAELHPGGGVALSVSHARGGGTARYESELAHQLRQQQGLGMVLLRPSRRAGCVALQALGGALDLPGLQAIDLDDGVAPLAELCRLLGVRQLLLQHTVDHPATLRRHLAELCDALRAPLHVTVHDYHLICPRINLVDASGVYCGEPDRAGCERCLQPDRARLGGIDDWRSTQHRLLQVAASVRVPDPDVATRLQRHYPDVQALVEPHEPLHLPATRPPAQHPPREVLVIGALSPIKGLQVLLGLAGSRAAAQAGLRFTLLGYSPQNDALRAAGVQVLGAYEDAELPARIAALAPDLILLPSVWPETFCYALTAAAQSGVRVAVFDLGAQARRLREAGADAIYLPLALAHRPAKLVERLLAEG